MACRTALAGTALLAIVVTGCAAGARWKGEFSAEQTQSLAREIARNATDAESAGARHVTWVLLQRPDPDPNPAITMEVLGELRHRYQVFTRLDSVPADSIVRGDRAITGFRSGFSFRFSVTVLSGGRVQVGHTSIWSSKGATIQTITYAWTEGVWKAVEVGPKGMS